MSCCTTQPRCDNAGLPPSYAIHLSKMCCCVTPPRCDNEGLLYSALHAVLRRSQNRKERATPSGQERCSPLHLRLVFNTQVQQDGLRLTTPGTTTTRRSWRPARPVSESSILGDAACCPTRDRLTRMLYILELAFGVARDQNSFGRPTPVDLSWPALAIKISQTSLEASSRIQNAFPETVSSPPD